MKWFKLEHVQLILIWCALAETPLSLHPERMKRFTFVEPPPKTEDGHIPEDYKPIPP